MKKLGRNEPCPCGSGLKYKECCWKKGFSWTQDEDGKIRKSIPLHPEVAAIIEKQRQEYIAKHGREPDPDSPIFPELSGMPAQEVTDTIAKAMQDADFDPAYVYAYRKTGLLVTEMNLNLIADKDLTEWKAAIAEYRLRAN